MSGALVFILGYPMVLYKYCVIVIVIIIIQDRSSFYGLMELSVSM